MNFSNLKIGARLGFSFAAILILLVVIAGMGIRSMAQIESQLEVITDVYYPKLKTSNSLLFTVEDRMIALRNIALLKEKSEMPAQVDRIKHEAHKYAEAEETLVKMVLKGENTSSEEKAIASKIQEANKALVPLIEKAIALGLASKQEEATKFMFGELRQSQLKLMGAINDFIHYEEKNIEELGENAEKNYAKTKWFMIILSGIVVVISALVAWLITRSITRPLNEAVKIAQTVAAGDLTSHIEVKSKDETGQLIQALKDMNTSLLNIVSQVRTGTDTIATASSQIASGNLDLSSRTEEQASSLEETASSMEELTSTVKQNADNARQANSLAKTASEVAGKGGAVVSQVVGTMTSINESAKKIVDIISVIDGIAFQTNILALNAAVEAARAGEQGRGFAVVAAEVRNLAQRSAGAAKEIKTLIGDSVEKVEAGSKLVDQAGATMDEVVGSVKRVTDIISEIAAASQEQSAGIEQINIAITEMDNITQQNAALVEEAAAAAGSLQEQADNLTQVVGVFKTDGKQMMTAAPNKTNRPDLHKTTVPAKLAAHNTTLPAVNSKKPLKPMASAPAGGSNSDDWEEF